jgi:ABC-2 type transport system permease protein
MVLIRLLLPTGAGEDPAMTALAETRRELWLVLCLLAPRGAFLIAQRLHPAPTTAELAAAFERIDAAEGSMDFAQQRAAIERRLLAEYRVRTAAELPVSTWGVTLYEREVESTARYNAVFAQVFDAYARQQRVVDVISLVVPPLALRTLSMAVAGTDTAHYRHFAEAAESYRFAMVQAMNTVAVRVPALRGLPRPQLDDGPSSTHGVVACV